MAVNGWSVPSAMEGVVGVTVIDTSWAAVTVSMVEPFTPVPESVAVIVVLPMATLEELVTESHRLVASKLTKKLRRELGLL